MKKVFEAALSYLLCIAVHVFFHARFSSGAPSGTARRAMVFRHLTWPSNHDPNILDLRQNARSFERAAGAIFCLRRHIGGAEESILSSFGYRLAR